MNTRQILLHAARALGVLGLARRLTAGRLRILAYHGASLQDEHEFRPGLFMRGETFRARMQLLKDRGYPVLALEDALERLQAGTLPPNAVVITIDDGWFGTWREMGPVLEAAGLPATLYVSSYYLEKQTQVFNVAVSYVLWKARDRTLDLARVSPALRGSFALGSAAARERAGVLIERHGDQAGGAQGRQKLFRRLCEAVGVDWRSLEADRVAGFMSADEARALAARGMDLQLHTHRHQFPASEAEAAAEIHRNRQCLAGLTARPTRHFCYPSGRYEAGQLAWLPRLGIVSAVTTTIGLNDRHTPVYELRRLLDSERLSAIEFEAELSGFGELVRWIKTRRPAPAALAVTPGR